MRQHRIGEGLRALRSGVACGTAPGRPGWALSCQNERIQCGGARLPHAKQHPCFFVSFLLCLCFGVPASVLWFRDLQFLDGPCALEQK